MSDPRYPALAFAIERVSNFTDRIKCNAELSDAECMAQQVAVMRIRLNAANGEIERLREQVKEARIEGREEILKTYDGTIGVPLDSWHAQRALLTRLAGSANEMKGMIERNELIRNIQADIKSDYIQRMMVFVQRLQKFDAALAEARAAGVVTE